MKCLSIKQPWAWAIIYAGKDVENRTWTPPNNYRGPLLIHASKGFDKKGYAWIIENRGILDIEDMPSIGYPETYFKRGGIIGKVNLKGLKRHPGYSPWMFGPWGWVLENPEPIDFIPYKGQLGLFNVPEDILP